MKFKFLIISIVLVFNVNYTYADEADCIALKKIVSKNTLDQSEKKKLYNNIDRLIKENSSCAKNLLGRIHYEGILENKNIDKAQGIFFDLSEKSYPPALYNLVYLSMQEKKASPEENISFLHGLLIKYSGHKEWGYISANARELGFEYLQNLHPPDASLATKETLTRLHSDVVMKTTSQLADIVNNRSIETRNTSNAIAELLMIAGAAYMVGNAFTNPNFLVNSTIYRSPSISTINVFAPPRLYQLMPTMNPNILYAVPIF